MNSNEAENQILEDSNEAGGDGGRLFVDLGSGAGAIPVRAESGKNQFLRSSHTGVVAFMLVLAAGGIWGMRWLGLGVRSAGAEVAIDIEREALPAIAAGKFTELMTELERGDHPVQIPLAKLTKKSPFELEVDDAEVIRDSTMETDQERAARLAEEDRIRKQKKREKKIKTELAKLKLFAVVGGRNPAARINMSVVREGDMIADLFTVTAIHARSVILECDGEQHELELAGKSGGS
jgi:Type II secretion system protein B